MPFSSGVFTRLYNWTTRKAGGAPTHFIDTTTMDAEMDGFATGLSKAILKDGTQTITANIPMSGFRHTNVGTPSARTDGMDTATVQDGVLNWIAAGGTADAITATYTPAITTLVDGQLCFVRASAANATTTPTFAPNGLTAHTIVKLGGSAVEPNDIAGVGHELILRYDLSNTQWELLNPSTAQLLSINWKADVICATTANITLSGEQTIDGVLTSADRVLVKDQTAPEENGIYVTDASTWTRAIDMDSWSEVPSAAVVVNQGTVNADSAWVCTSDDGGTLDTTAITWADFGSTFIEDGTITGAKLANNSLTGDTGSVAVDNEIPRWNGTDGKTFQASGVVVDDDSNLSGHGAEINAQTGTTYTVVGTDNGKVITCNNAAAVTVTLPQTSTETIAAGFQCTIIQIGAGQVTVAYEGTDTINGASTNIALNAQYDGVYIVKNTAGSPNSYLAIGDFT